jgi:hypothetical protein
MNGNRHNDSTLHDFVGSLEGGRFFEVPSSVVIQSLAVLFSFHRRGGITAEGETG